MDNWTPIGTQYITVRWVPEERTWVASCHGIAFNYPLAFCKGETTAARKALRAYYTDQGHHVKITSMTVRKHYGKDVWDFAAEAMIR